MSVHDIYRLVLISKSIKFNIEVPPSVNHLEVDIPTVPRTQALAVLDQCCLTENSNANKIRFIKHAFSQGHGIYSCCGRRILYCRCTLKQNRKIAELVACFG